MSLYLQLSSSISVAWNVHFSGLTNRLFSSKHLSTSRMILSCLAWFVKIIRLLMYTTTTSSMSAKISFIIAWEVAGKLHNPEYMTRGSNDLWKQVNATFHLLFSLMWTLLYPHLRSIFVNNLAPWSLSTSCAINGNG